MSKPITRPEQCPGCHAGLSHPHQHASVCPVFAHAHAKQLADFIECACGYLSVTSSDRAEHLRDAARRQRTVIAAGIQ